MKRQGSACLLEIELEVGIKRRVGLPLYGGDLFYKFTGVTPLISYKPSLLFQAVIFAKNRPR